MACLCLQGGGIAEISQTHNPARSLKKYGLEPAPPELFCGD